MSWLLQSVVQGMLCWTLHKTYTDVRKWCDLDEAFRFCRMEMRYFTALSFLNQTRLYKKTYLLSLQSQEDALKMVKRLFPRSTIHIPSHWLRISKVGLLQDVYVDDSGWQPFIWPTRCVNPNLQQVHPRLSTCKPGRQSCVINMHSILKKEEEEEEEEEEKDMKKKKKELKGRPLLCFWRQIEQREPCEEVVGIHYTILKMRCLEACRADTSSSYLDDAVKRSHHLTLRDVSEWLLAWLNFDGDKDVHRRFHHHGGRILRKPLEWLL
ncbi:hypothetical protein RFI_20069, partial [Reticulomyxa filosa]